MHILRFVGLMLLGAALVQQNHSANAQEERSAIRVLEVTHPRPVWEATRKFAKEHGYVITYEDPMWMYEGELEDVTDQVRRSPWKPGDIRVVAPKVAPLRVEYQLSEAGRPTNVRQLIDDVLRADAQRIGERFKLVQDGDAFHIIPTRTRDKSGRWVSAPSLLDTRISIPSGQREAADYFIEICRELSKTTGKAIEPGTWPINLFSASTTDGAENEVARDVVMRLLRAYKYKLSYVLGYDVGLQRYYFSIDYIAAPPRELVRDVPDPFPPGGPSPIGRGTSRAPKPDRQP